MRRFFVPVVMFLLAVPACAQLTQAERDGLASALFLRNLTLKDLDFVRRGPGGPMPLPAVQEAIDHPLEGADALMRLHASAASGGLADLLGRAQAQLRIPLSVGLELPPAPLPDAVPAVLRTPLGKIVAAMHEANDQIRAALSALTPEERRTLIDSLPVIAAERRVTFGFTKSPPVSASAAQVLVAKIDLPRLLGAASVLANRVEAEIPVLRAAAATSLATTLSFMVDDVPVEISGSGSTIHKGLAGGLCVALAGDNHYAGRYGAGVAASSVLIDFGTSATYDVPDLSAGAGLLGIGLAYEFAQRAHFEGRSLAFGAGLAGVGALFREGGDDNYYGATLSEGYGCHGIGLLAGTGGSDQYRIVGWGEGAGAEGGIGWLINRMGENIFLATGFPDGSFAQGYGRGGVGLLSDLAGKNTYRATSRCQGTGERLGVGSLFNSKGKDTYFADSAAQGFGADTGSGMLFDFGGNGAFVVRGGACQGTAQSRSVAVLLERGGNNYFSSGDGRPGLATDGGLGIFLESQGGNRFASAPGGSVPGRYGDALGVFLELGDDNIYTDGLEGGQARVESDGAVAYDTGNGENVPPIEGFAPQPGSIKNTGPGQVDALADEGTITAANQLVAIGAPAYVRLMQRPLASMSPPIFNAVIRLGHLLRQNAYAPVLAKLNGSDVEDQGRALYLAASFGITSAAPQVEKLLANPATKREAAEAAGLLRVRPALPALLKLAGSDDPSLALLAMLAIERIGDEAGIPAADALVTSPVFPTRQSALRLLSHFSASGTVTAKKLVADPDERLKRIGIELYGRIGSEDALAQAAQFLGAASPGLKIQAMVALDGRCPAPYRSTLAALRFDPNAAVRAVAARIDPGR